MPLETGDIVRACWYQHLSVACTGNMHRHVSGECAIHKQVMWKLWEDCRLWLSLSMNKRRAPNGFTDKQSGLIRWRPVCLLDSTGACMLYKHES